MAFKNIENGYIWGVCLSAGEFEITESEYNAIMQKIRSKPVDPDGYIYQLRADTLEWELVKLPPVDPSDEDIPDEEALDIILGGGSHET